MIKDNLGLPQKLKLIRRSALMGIVFLLPISKPLGISVTGTKALSQIVPDNTLGNENSQVSPTESINNLPTVLIEGGAARGQNLFHSFSEFNVETGQGAYFANPEGIANIFSRVTGNDVSDILGTLGVRGNADLFLINPNGIIFGEGASLDFNGSFIGTTADAIQFGDRNFFSATNPQEPPLLTVKPSAFFFNQINRGQIAISSVAPTTTVDILGRSSSGLVVPNGESLLFIGGEIAIAGGSLHALDGRIQLVSVADTGTLELDTTQETPTVKFPSQLQLADISISNEAFINTSNAGGGAINLQGKNINISNRSFIFAGTLGDLDGQGIAIAAENLAIDQDSGITTDVLGAGNGGDINIDSNKSLFITENSFISSTSFGQGDSGNLNLKAFSFSILGNSGLNVSVAGSASANNFRQAGNINITANEVIFDGGFAFARLEAGTIGRAGDINITTDSLLVTGIPEEAATNNIGQLVTATFGQGDAGDLTINATGNVVFDGDGSDVFSLVAADFSEEEVKPLGIGDAGDIKITADSLTVTNQARLVSLTESLGDAGNIIIDTNSLTISDRGELFSEGRLSEVDGQVIGDAGNINITTDSMILDGGILNAQTLNPETFSTEGSNFGGAKINLQIAKNLQLSNESKINAAAFGVANGGNITIDAEFILAFASGNLDGSDIVANASERRGGRIEINAKGIFGLEVRDQLTENNDITAFSEQNPQLDGTIKLNTTEVIQNLDSFRLPSNLPSIRVVQTCQQVGSLQKSRFTLSGRGGLPDSPQSSLGSDLGLEDWRLLEADSFLATGAEKAPPESKISSQQIVEANTWIFNDRGQLLLISTDSNAQGSNWTPQLVKNCLNN